MLWVTSKYYDYVAAYSLPDYKLLKVVPVGLHPATHTDVSNAARLFNLIRRSADMAETNKVADPVVGGTALSIAVGAPVDAIVSLGRLLMGGVCERFPGLRLVAGEVNCGWVPFWAQTMDQEHDVASAMYATGLSRPPSAVLGENVFVTVLDDDVGFEHIARGSPRLADACMFSTDYPHSVTLWPTSRSYVERLTKDLTDVDREKVLSGNAARVYRV